MDRARGRSSASDTVIYVDGYTSLKVVDGKPAISDLDGTNRDLKYARNSTVDGSGLWTLVSVDTAGFVGQFTSLAVHRWPGGHQLLLMLTMAC